jgi:hypothetical protein
MESNPNKDRDRPQTKPPATSEAAFLLPPPYRLRREVGMWKDWLERTLTRNKAPVMLASEIMCAPANSNELGRSPDASARAHADKKSTTVKPLEPAGV